MSKNAPACCKHSNNGSQCKSIPQQIKTHLDMTNEICKLFKRVADCLTSIHLLSSVYWAVERPLLLFMHLIKNEVITLWTVCDVIQSIGLPSPLSLSQPSILSHTFNWSIINKQFKSFRTFRSLFDSHVSCTKHFVCNISMFVLSIENFAKFAPSVEIAIRCK